MRTRSYLLATLHDRLAIDRSLELLYASTRSTPLSVRPSHSCMGKIVVGLSIRVSLPAK